ncbi:thioredoxin 1 [Geoalkalibacter ferrihydriticus]|uniref:Thioredoxin domain-containing protein n=2 Tax=Geoalkalibacter ferrihydriticus TaxID=392333 RepID=A0A0C2HKZ0_9BACT|nr:hypothetical protein [Geoalkalibacter ferrihydriticus]KIH77721.1 hypothetical protein GFER_03430 [Geoalkalibacter ferrihydriticus DSM 17813]SDL75646.1 thioredoxin 1 [Geoalkalibacter ferrihydriticus]
MLRKIFLVLVCLVAVGCSEGKNSGSAGLVPANAQDIDKVLVFFLDPTGGPCIMQAQILDGMGAELDGRVALRYVQTTVPEDRPFFGQYGIRGLPALLLADASGRELGRLAPGVKSAGEIRNLIHSVN